MAELELIKHDIQPWFEIEEFMNFSKENRLDGEAFDILSRLWQEWFPLVNIYQIKTQNDSWLAVWMPEEVEQLVDKTWEESPGKGYLINNLAQFFCMSTVQELLPQVANGGCAPMPKMNEDLKEALLEAGLNYQAENSDILSRRYALVTYYPFKAGCEVCNLRENCPKGGGEGDNFASILLKGYEK